VGQMISSKYHQVNKNFYGHRGIVESRTLGGLGIGVILAVIVGDQLRIILPGQPIWVSFVPHVLAVIGLAFAWNQGRLKKTTKELKEVVGLILLLCVYGSVVGFANGLPVKQVLAGWFSYAGLLPGLLLGYAIGQSTVSFYDFGRWSQRMFLICILIALFQQFGLFAISVDVLEGVPLQRGTQGFGGLRFSYTSGPFRTASVFSAFLAFVSVVVLIYRESIRFTFKKKNLWITAAIIFITVLASLLAARRSGLLMLIGCVLPFLLLSARRLFWKVIITTALVLFLWGQYFTGGDSNVSVEVGAKLAHSTTNTGIASRISGVFDVREQDIRLLSLMGDGLGSYGPSVRVAGPIAIAKAQYRLDMHPIIHFGWFKDIAAFGVMGFLIHILAFYKLCAAAHPPKRLSKHVAPSIKWSVFGLSVSAVVVYLFIATSWLQGITGGVLFGMAVGFGVGYISCKDYSYIVSVNKNSHSVKRTVAN